MTTQERLGAELAADSLIVMFIPSVDRDENAIEHMTWVTASLKMLGTLFGGGTAFPQGYGVWRDDQRGGELIFDEPSILQCYTKAALIEQHLESLRDFLVRMEHETHQAAVGIVLNGVYYEIKLEGK